MIFLTRFVIFCKNGTVGCCWGIKVPVFPETYVWSGCEGFRSMLYKLGGGDKGGGEGHVNLFPSSLFQLDLFSKKISYLSAESETKK